MNELETRYSISPKKVNKTYYECLAFGTLFTTIEQAFKFALSKSNCRAFELCEVQGRSCGNNLFTVSKYLNKKIVKRKDLTTKE